MYIAPATYILYQVNEAFLDQNKLIFIKNLLVSIAARSWSYGHTTQVRLFSSF
jgi:hypothetical protein